KTHRYYTIDGLERAFSRTGTQREQRDDGPFDGAECRDEGTLRQLLGRNYRAILDAPGRHSRPTPSHADMALLSAMARRDFTREEMWLLLEDSPRLADRIKRKGEKHARALYEREITKAFERGSKERVESASSASASGETRNGFRLLRDVEMEEL